MDAIFTLCLGLGIGIATGALAAATGRLEATISPLMLAVLVVAAGVAAAIGLLREDGALGVLAAPAGALGAALSGAGLGSIVASAHRRSESAAGVTSWLVAFAALVVVATLLLAPVALLPGLALGYLWLSRRRREGRKYKGLRSLT